MVKFTTATRQTYEVRFLNKNLVIGCKRFSKQELTKAIRKIEEFIASDKNQIKIGFNTEIKRQLLVTRKTAKLLEWCYICKFGGTCNDSNDYLVRITPKQLLARLKKIQKLLK